MNYIFSSPTFVNFVKDGKNYYGIETHLVTANSRREAWDKIRETIPSAPLTLDEVKQY